MEGKVEDKIQRKMQNLGNEKEMIFTKFSYFLVHCLNDSHRPLFIWKNMVIQFGEGLQEVKWLGNPPYPIKSTEIRAILYFFAIFGGKCGITSMKHAYVCVRNNMQHVYVRRLKFQHSMYIIKKVIF
jgi:hypothetical protein